eukprot:g43782.t1
MAAGADSILTESLRCEGIQLLLQLHAFVSLIWKEESTAGELRDAMSIFKKGNKSDPGNYRGISLLSTVRNVIAKFLLDCLLSVAEELLPESQCGFWPLRGTTDMIFTVRQLKGKCREKKLPTLYMIFFDLTKAFDTVSEE